MVEASEKLLRKRLLLNIRLLSIEGYFAIGPEYAVFLLINQQMAEVVTDSGRKCLNWIIELHCLDSECVL